MKWYFCTTCRQKCKEQRSKPLYNGIYCTKEAGSGNIVTDLYLEGTGLNLGWETNYCDRVFILFYYYFFFTFMWPCIMTNFLIIKTTRCTNFSNFILEMKLHVLDSSSAHRQEWFTVHSAIMVYVTHVCRQLSSSSRIRISPYTIAECTVNNSWRWTEELSETCRVSFPK
jgi:hypothetical protein